MPLTDVRVGSFASIWSGTDDFCSTPYNRHRYRALACLKGAMSGSKQAHASTSLAPAEVARFRRPSWIRHLSDAHPRRSAPAMTSSQSSGRVYLAMQRLPGQVAGPHTATPWIVLQRHLLPGRRDPIVMRLSLGTLESHPRNVKCSGRLRNFAASSVVIRLQAPGRHPSVIMASTKAELNRYFEMIHRRVPTRISHLIRWLRQPSSFTARLAVAILFIIGGIFSFLPVLGIWMLPLGLLLIAQDVHFLQKPLVASLSWTETQWDRLRLKWQRESAVEGASL
jgi:hypothetical protein